MSPPLEPRVGHILAACAISVAGVGVVTAYNTDLPVRRPPMAATRYPGLARAPTYVEERQRHHDNRLRHPGNLRVMVARAQELSDAGAPTEEEHAQAIARRAERRAYDGAPPTVPHPVAQRDGPACLTCHGEGMRVATQVAPAICHTTHANCLQCHVASESPVPGVATERPDRVCGVHFFNPAPAMALVEIVRPLTASDETIAAVTEFASACGKNPVQVKDQAGFIVNALLFPYLNNAVRLLENGTATAEDIDTAMKGGCNFPMGPLALLDLVGLDTSLSILDALYDEFRDPNYAAVPVLRRMVSAGQLGGLPAVPGQQLNATITAQTDEIALQYRVICILQLRLVDDGLCSQWLCFFIKRVLKGFICNTDGLVMLA